jgi:hypothetical protein
MDPITLAITGALANLGVEVISDAYIALKAVLQEKYGVDSKLAGAVEELENEPDFKPNQDALAGRVAQAKADQDPDIQKMVETLLAEINKLSGQSEGTTTNITQTAGDNATQFGTVGGDVTIKK